MVTQYRLDSCIPGVLHLFHNLNCCVQTICLKLKHKMMVHGVVLDKFHLNLNLHNPSNNPEDNEFKKDKTLERKPYLGSYIYGNVSKDSYKNKGM